MQYGGTDTGDTHVVQRTRAAMSAGAVVHVVDDDSSFRTAVTRMLTATGLSVRSYATATELLAHLSGNAATEVGGCVLADLCMPGFDGLQLQEACIAAGVALPFVFLTGQGDVPSAVTAMRHGAVDFLDKCAPRQALLGSLERAIESDAKVRSARARRARLEHRFAELTEREMEVLGHIVRGKMNKQIAAMLGLHERTVKLHRKAISTKLGVRSVAEVTTLTRQAGLFAEAQEEPCPKG
jgi:two-component system, LuxR family, response regulator FixJ